MYSLGSFGKIAFVDYTIREEVNSYPRRRQVVDVLLIAKYGQDICLCLPEGAKKDGRLNLSPPQGGVEKGETLAQAAVRELYEELGIRIASPVSYLGSAIRKLRDDHKQASSFDEYHHHFVAVFSSSHRMSLDASVAEAGWHHFSNLENVARFSMSKEKGVMTLAAVKELLLVSNGAIPLPRDIFDQTAVA